MPDTESHVVGSAHLGSYEQTPGVRVRGYVEELRDAFEPASLYVQPSRMDTFPVCVLEAMRAGLSPLVTETTGTRSEAREIDPSLVVPPAVDGLWDYGEDEPLESVLWGDDGRSGGVLDECRLRRTVGCRPEDRRAPLRAGVPQMAGIDAVKIH